MAVGCLLGVVGMVSAAVAAELPETSLTLEPGASKYMPVKLEPAPPGKPVAVLSFKAWIEFPILAGANPALQVALGGVKLTRDLGRPDEVTFVHDGRVSKLFAPGQGWFLFYAPGADALRTPNDYWVSDTFDPAAFKLVIEDYQPGETEVELTSTLEQPEDGSEVNVRIEDLKIEFLSEQEAEDYQNQ